MRKIKLTEKIAARVTKMEKRAIVKLAKREMTDVASLIRRAICSEYDI